MKVGEKAKFWSWDFLGLNSNFRKIKSTNFLKFGVFLKIEGAFYQLLFFRSLSDHFVRALFISRKRLSRSRPSLFTFRRYHFLSIALFTFRVPLLTFDEEKSQPQDNTLSKTKIKLISHFSEVTTPTPLTPTPL